MGRPKSDRKCGHSECDRPHHANGWCKKHDKRVRLYGDVEHTGLQFLPAEDRFWRQVEKRAGKNACWVWIGAYKGDGYGTLRWEGTYQGAHRVSWQITNGEIPEGVLVCHTCDNPPCVRPSHLFLGSHSDNMLDARDKGRLVLPMLKGEQSPLSVLTESDVAEIRLRHRNGEKVTNIATDFPQVTKWALYKVTQNKRW